MTLLQTNVQDLVVERSGNHIIARLSHEATAKSLENGLDTAARLGRLHADALADARQDGIWDHMRPQDCVDEALMESFPASDAPAFTYCHA